MNTEASNSIEDLSTEEAFALAVKAVSDGRANRFVVGASECSNDLVRAKELLEAFAKRKEARFYINRDEAKQEVADSVLRHHALLPENQA